MSSAKNSLSTSKAYAQFAVWLQAFEPGVFNALLKQIPVSVQLGKLYASKYARRRKSGLGGYFDYANYTADLSNIESSAVSDALNNFEVPLDTDISGGLEGELSTDSESSIADSVSAETAIATANPMTEDISADIPSDVSGSIPSDISSAVPTMPSVAPSPSQAAVGSSLVSASSAQLLTAALNAANQVLSSNQAAAVIAAQAARAAAGMAPANVGYTTVTDPTTGQVTAIPVLNTSNGAIGLDSAGIEALAPSTFLQTYGLYIILGIAAFYALG